MGLIHHDIIIVIIGDANIPLNGSHTTFSIYFVCVCLCRKFHEPGKKMLSSFRDKTFFMVYDENSNKYLIDRFNLIN